MVHKYLPQICFEMGISRKVGLTHTTLYIWVLNKLENENAIKIYGTKYKYVELVENTMKLYVANSCNMSKSSLADIYAPNA